MQLPAHFDAWRADLLQEIESNPALSRQDRHEARTGLGAAKLGGLFGSRVFTPDPSLAWQFIKDLTKRVIPARTSNRMQDTAAVSNKAEVDAAVTAVAEAKIQAGIEDAFAEIEDADAAIDEARTEHTGRGDGAMSADSTSRTGENGAAAQAKWPAQWRNNALLLVAALAKSGRTDLLDGITVQDLITDTPTLVKFIEQIEGSSTTAGRVGSAEPAGGKHRASAPASPSTTHDRSQVIATVASDDSQRSAAPGAADVETEAPVNAEPADGMIAAAAGALSSSTTPTPPNQAPTPAPASVAAGVGAGVG